LGIQRCDDVEIEKYTKKNVQVENDYFLNERDSITDYGSNFNHSNSFCHINANQGESIMKQ
jgi:hypothetical protein